MASKQPSLLENYSAQAATFRTVALNVSGSTWVGYSLRTTTSDGIGAWSIQYSNDFDPIVDSPTSDAKWDTYTLTTTPPNSASANQTFGIVLDDYEYKYVRIKYTRTSGTLTTVLVASQMKGS